MSKIKIAVIFFVIFAFLSVNTYASMDDYLTNVVSNISNLSPKSYHSQQRGFFVGGTMHIPPLGQTIQPFSVTLPSLHNNSCGGINVEMGGFSYLNFQYLVKKLQAIIQAAPALAFQIAISVLSEKLKNGMNVLAGITNAINNLNFNSCSAMNGIHATLSNAINDAINAGAKAASNGQNSGGSDWFGAGLTKFADDIKSGFNSWIHNMETKTASTVSHPNVVGGVPNGGMLAQTATDIGGLPGDFVNMMRYYVGDIIPTTVDTSSSTQPAGSYIQPCATVQDFISDLKNGQLKEITFQDLKNHACHASQTFNNGGMDSYVRSKLWVILTALASNTNISDQGALNLIELSPIPIYDFLKQAALTGDVGSATGDSGIGGPLIDQLADPIAKGLVIQAASKFIITLRTEVSGLLSQQKIASNKNVQQSTHRLIAHLTQMEMQLYPLYTQSLQKAQAVYGNFYARYMRLKKNVEQQLLAVQLQQAVTWSKINGAGAGAQ